MPWWNYSVSDARALGASFGRAFLTTLDEIKSGAVPPATENASVGVPRWEMYEFAVNGRSHVENPFRDAALVGEFISPSGKTRVVDGFHDGGTSWRLRFAPDEEGEWSYLLRGEGVEILERGKLTCTKPRGHGIIRVHPENPYSFAYSDGTAFFPMGDTCYGLYDDSPITPALREEYLKVRRSQRFNFVRMTVGHSEQRAGKDPKYWAWGGTLQNPDLDRFNPEFFRGLDDLILQLRGQGMNVEVILLNFYRRPFTDTSIWTPARERMWLRYVIARYAAFDNVLLWTIANEYETHPDGRYRLDFPDDVEWAKSTARLIKETDPWQHLVTVHPVMSASRRGESPRAPFDPPWRIGEFFGDEGAIDVLSQQTGQIGDGTTWDESLQSWTGDSTTLVGSIRADRRFKKPVLNSENGYEYLRGDPTSRKQVHHTDKVRRSAWRIVCAGGYIAAGFHGTLGHSDAWNRLDGPNHYTFAVKDQGAAVQLASLHEFFSALPFWRMQPFDGVTDNAVALADPGKVYVVYLPKGGSTSVDLSGVQGQFFGSWFDPRLGKFDREFSGMAGSRSTFETPDTRDWALLLKF
jgi:hypothetical protein